MPFKALVLDIEGTITSISFVKDELFPCAYENVGSFLTKHFGNADVVSLVAELAALSKEEAAKDSEVRLIDVTKDSENIISDIVFNVRRWITLDYKLTAMKKLQGMIWKDAYEAGTVKGHVYEDVLPVLKKVGVPIYIYSSGSVQAQQLLFAHSVNGDMTKILSGYFDTNIGLKGDRESYSKICEKIEQKPEDVLFLTDIEAEARAATAAGLQSKLVIRPGNGPLSDEAKRDFETIKTLDEIL